MIVVVSDSATTLLAPALVRAGFTVRSWSAEEATEDPGFAVGAQLVVLAFAPGTHPLIESQSYQHAQIIYAHVDGSIGTVGPSTTRSEACCPACLAASAPPTAVGARDRAVSRWVAATLALEVTSIARHRSSTLVETSLAWSIADPPGLTATSHHRRPGCRTDGCTG